MPSGTQYGQMVLTLRTSRHAVGDENDIATHILFLTEHYTADSEMFDLKYFFCHVLNSNIQLINKTAIFAKLNLIQYFMLIERIANNQITISFSSGTDMFGIQRLIDYAKYLDATSKSKAKQSDVDKLADEVNTNWWNQNKHRFLK